MRFNIFSVIIFAVSCVALTISAPKSGDEVDLSKSYEIKWRSVQSDPSKFSINLVNMNGSSANKEIAKDIDASQGSVKVDKVWGIPKGTGYQLNFISNDKMNTGILAQSQQFEVTKVADRPKNTTTTTSSSSSPTESTAEPTNSTAGASSLAIPATFGSLMVSLFALVL
ncbi:hypothetical protein P170DRAFT_433002 [Aspergillus steynii IBT 23096]|uniref:Yeast cell wall synthesis Kre9/Knh1-like N-terminal domain-containing protein n=1 Tax=Aspergillus steynii IBT 23096 TaxID=1392250 RepID=A0A2I2GRI5_9EURO|nr:uncharacterized protein P170DRAFT_433002 [Aspergillus steynii IBT 23096]PLB55464.1 hypothetical protein P170DRAFT_433002 [Aspergillus steynii IBT 23096]